MHPNVQTRESQIDLEQRLIPLAAIDKPKPSERLSNVMNRDVQLSTPFGVMKAFVHHRSSINGT